MNIIPTDMHGHLPESIRTPVRDTRGRSERVQRSQTTMRTAGRCAKLVTHDLGSNLTERPTDADGDGPLIPLPLDRGILLPSLCLRFWTNPFTS